MSLLIAHTEAEVSEEVPAQPADVRAFYVDLDNIKLVHPLIVSVQTTSRTESSEGYQHSYRVVDRIPLGPLTLKITYRAQLHVPNEGDVLTEADQFPRVRLRGRVSFEPIDTGTLVTERIRITAPRPLIGTTAREGIKAHIEMLAGIRSHFESA
jgi:hypothetical protein